MTPAIMADGAASAANIAEFVEVIERASQRWWPRPPALDGRTDEEPQEDQLWQALVEAGATVAGLAEPLGGLGAGVLGSVAVIAAAARSLQPASLLATTGLVAPVLNALVGTSGEAAAREIAGRLAAGERATVALAPSLRSAAQRLTGTVETVIDADRSDLVIVVAGGGGDTTIVSLEPSTPGVTVVPVSALDETRGFADLRLDLQMSAASLLLAGSAAASLVRVVMPQLSLAVAADSVGGAEQAVADAVEYAGVREQFGRRIGSFQGLRHLIVDTYVCAEQAAASVRHAARATAWESSAARIDAHIAKALATEAYTRAASTSVQVHGGIGFTRGITAHLHVKRARANEALLGTALWHRERLGELLAHDVPEDW